MSEAPPVVSGFWDYCGDGGDHTRIVVVDEDGAGVLACANVAGAQLQHLYCPLAGPCAVEHPYGPEV